MKMNKRSRRRIGRRLPELPEAMIQQIQSYMTGKEATRTALLSKSWRSAWLTRPRLNFDERDFKYDVPKFEEFATKVMRRYRKLDLKIESFRLYSWYSRNNDDFCRKLIVNAIKIGATDLQIEMPPYPFSFLPLPQEVLGSQTLVRLSITRCSVDSSYAISCSSLKSLTLNNVTFTSDGDLLDNILVSCRASIEEVSLSRSRLKDLHELHKLRRLFLSHVEVDDTVFSKDFASRFPCLEDLSIHKCFGCRTIRIDSTSLQTISYKPPVNVHWRAEFDVPNIRKFSYSGRGWCLPSSKKLSIEASREWEFDVSIRCNGLYDSEWFLKLKKYLTKYRLASIANISLYKSKMFAVVVLAPCP